MHKKRIKEINKKQQQELYKKLKIALIIIVPLLLNSLINYINEEK